MSFQRITSKVLENYQGVLISWLLKFLLYKHNSNLSHLTCTALFFSFAFPGCVFLLNHCVFLMVSWFWCCFWANCSKTFNNFKTYISKPHCINSHINAYKSCSSWHRNVPPSHLINLYITHIIESLCVRPGAFMRHYQKRLICIK